MNRSKLAIVANSCWNIYNYRRELIRHLVMNGTEVIVIAPVDQYIHYLTGNQMVKHIPVDHLDAHRITPIKDLRYFYQLYKIYKREKPDLVFQFTIKPNIYGSLAARLLKIKAVSTLTGLGIAFRKWKYGMLLNSFYRYALSTNCRVVFHNMDDLNYLVNNHWVDVEKAMVIHGSGVDTNEFKFIPYSKNKEEFVFLFSGRLIKDKGLEEFVKAAKHFWYMSGKVEFWVLGEFNPNNPNSIDEKELLQWIQSGVIKYYGHERDVRKYLNRADVIVLPSYREGLPRAILEAMSMQKPIISTDVPGCRDLVRHGWNGYLVTPGNTQALTEAMQNMFNLGNEQRMRMGKNSRQRVLEKFDLNLILHSYDELIEEILGNKVYSSQDFKDQETEA